MRTLDMIVDGKLRPLYIFLRHIDIKCRSYLTENKKNTKLG
jgi:hypothetical protein